MVELNTIEEKHNLTNALQMRIAQERMTNSPTQQLTRIARTCYDVCNIIDVSVMGDNQQEIQKRVALGRRYALRLCATDKQAVSHSNSDARKNGRVGLCALYATGAISQLTT